MQATVFAPLTLSDESSGSHLFVCLGIFSLLPNNRLVLLVGLLGLGNATLPYLVNRTDPD